MVQVENGNRWLEVFVCAVSCTAARDQILAQMHVGKDLQGRSGNSLLQLRKTTPRRHAVRCFPYRVSALAKCEQR